MKELLEKTLRHCLEQASKSDNAGDVWQWSSAAERFSKLLHQEANESSESLPQPTTP
jgi:hypothetical protein